MLKEKLRPLVELREGLMSKNVDEKNLIGSNYIEKIDKTTSQTNIHANWLFTASYIKSVHLSSAETPYCILIESTSFKNHNSDVIEEYAPQLCFPEDLGRSLSIEDLKIYEKQVFQKCILYKQLNKYLEKVPNHNIKYIFCNIDLTFPPSLIERHSTISTLFLESLSALRQIVDGRKVILVGVNFSNPLTNILTGIKEEWKIYGNDYNFVRDILTDEDISPAFENPDCKEFKKASKGIYKSGYDSFFKEFPIYTYYLKNSETVFKIDYFAKEESTYEEKLQTRKEISEFLSSFLFLPYDGKMLPEPFAELIEKCKGRVEHDTIANITELQHELRRT